MKKKQSISLRKKGQQGFTLVELAIAIVVLMVGIVAVAQLVPASLQSNLNNRADTTASVLAQRELDQMVNQPLSATSFVDKDGRAINLGTPGGANTSNLAGGPVVARGTTEAIDFTASPVAGYNFTYADPNDPTAAAYVVRWAVVDTTNSAGTVVSKRVIIGCQNAIQPLFPVNLDTWVHKF